MAMVFEGTSAIQSVRSILGSGVHGEAATGTIRGDLREYREPDKSSNFVHASDSTGRADLEIKLWLGPFSVSQ